MATRYRRPKFDLEIVEVEGGLQVSQREHTYFARNWRLTDEVRRIIDVALAHGLTHLWQKGTPPGPRPEGRPAGEEDHRICFSADDSRDSWVFCIGDKAGPPAVKKITFRGRYETDLLEYLEKYESIPGLGKQKGGGKNIFVRPADLEAVLDTLRGVQVGTDESKTRVGPAPIGEEWGARPTQIPEIADALNEAAAGFEISRLQEVRVRLRSLKRAPCRALFNSQTTHDDYAFHVGGRKELQFNIGKERLGGRDVVRHGVAFSLELSQALPTIDPLLPKIERFNDYVRSHPEDFPDFHMWHDTDRRGEDGPVSPITDDLIVPGTFIMLGRWVPVEQVDVLGILADFDRLLPLYISVESGQHSPMDREPLAFEPGCPRFVEHTVTRLPERTLDVALRHKVVQRQLYDLLCQEAGADDVSIEHSLDLGLRVDAAVRENDALIFYEVKLAPTVRSCLRAAMGQLLEYAHWPTADRAAELIVVGEAEVDEDGAAYLRFLRSRFALPLWYRRIDGRRNVLEQKS